MTRTIIAAAFLLAAAPALAGDWSHEYLAGPNPDAPRSLTIAQPAERPLIHPSDMAPEQVRLVQRTLDERGFAARPTGKFDDRTRDALTDFQRELGLKPTGQLDPSTVDLLGIDPGSVMPVRGKGE
jgi:hypothetical protein